MDPGAFVALPQCSPEALAAAAAGLAVDQEPAAPQLQEVEVAGSVCSRRVCGRVMFFELRGAEDQNASARVQVMLQCSVCGEQLYQEVRQQVTVGCSVTFAGVPGLSRRGDISLVATGYSSLRQPAGPANNRASVSARTPAGASSGTPSCCQILYQDEHIIAVDKPARLPVLASGRGRKRPRAADTLLERLASQLGVSAQPNESADGVGLHSVHRLDQDTSGVVLFALDPASAATLRSEWRSTTTRYVTLVAGGVDRAAAWLADAPLRRVQHRLSSSQPQSTDPAPEDGKASSEETGSVNAVGVLACGPEFIGTTLGLGNRVRDRAMVEHHLGLPEDGACWGGSGDNLKLVDLRGQLLATEYTRVLYGDHGPYLEFTLAQLTEGRRRCEWQSMAALDGAGAYYLTHYTSKGDGAKVYEQRKTVASKPNPPRTGSQWAWNNRPEGYADYKVGYCYVSCFQVIVEGAGGEQTQEGGGDQRRQQRLRQRSSAAAASGADEHNLLQPARTGFLRLATSTDSESLPALSLLLATVHTNSTHQIRRHLAGSGTPVVGDGHYGQAKTNRRFKGVFGLGRVLLHSAYLRFQHPVTRVWHTVESALPPDLAEFLARLPPLSGGHWATEASVGPSGWADGVSSLSALAFRHMHLMPPADDGGDGASGSEGEFPSRSACKHKRQRLLNPDGPAGAIA